MDENTLNQIEKWCFRLKCGIEDEIKFKDDGAVFVSASDVYVDMKRFIEENKLRRKV